MKTYLINEIFYSLQGEGARAGEPSIFVRFSKCNLSCVKETHGFDCDTEFESGIRMTAKEVRERADQLSQRCIWLVLTGGEPGLQLDEEFVSEFHREGYRLAIETNGTIDLTDLDLDWVCVSPKVAEHALKQRSADEVKYVRGYGQAIPKTVVAAGHHFISPAFDGDTVTRETLDWCIKLCLDNPPWRLSVQQHKLWKVR